MPVTDDTTAHRRRLPHLTRPSQTYYVTFCTSKRFILSPEARTIALRHCIREHESTCWLDSVTVMPDHVHLIVMPYESTSLSNVLGRMKGSSSRFINLLAGRQGKLWQTESFDRLGRKSEILKKKRAYIFENPVRAGSVSEWSDYAWSWYPGRELG